MPKRKYSNKSVNKNNKNNSDDQVLESPKYNAETATSKTSKRKYQKVTDDQDSVPFNDDDTTATEESSTITVLDNGNIQRYNTLLYYRINKRFIISIFKNSKIENDN